MALAAACLSVLACSTPLSAQEPARSADSLVESIGVVTHWGYPDTPYGYAYDRIKALLGASGIRHIRDGYHPREDDLYKAYGIQTTVIFGPSNQPPAQQIAFLKDHLPLVDMIEGPNEVDLFPSSANYNGQGYPQGPKNYQHDLYAAVKADPLLTRVPVISFSLGMGRVDKITPATDFDFEVMHSYAGGRPPAESLENQNGSNILNANRFVGPGHDIKPIVATESGYHTALGGSGVIAGVQPGVSEAAQAKYLPRQFCEYFNHGIVRDFTYEFDDEFPDYKDSERQGTNAEACFGIVRHDLTPKPAYYAEKNLIALLSEAHWDAAAQRWDKPKSSPDALRYSLGGSVGDVHHTLLQKSNGDFYLLLWQEVSSFDTTEKQDIVNPPAPVTLTLGMPMKSVALCQPNKGLQWTPMVLHGRRLTLNVPDQLLVVRLTPAKTAHQTLAAPNGLVAAATTGTSATLAWHPVLKAAGYFVSRMGQFIGRASVPRFTDTNLSPATGYTYTVAAYGGGGAVSPGASAVARTRNVFPDLTVADLSWSPAMPKAGDAVTFTVTVKNQGTAPTPAGTILGVAFQIDGTNVNWSDTFREALRPGQSHTLTANNGNKGTVTWTATPGNHTVTAIVDDINRINESRKDNNSLARPLTVGSG